MAGVDENHDENQEIIEDAVETVEKASEDATESHALSEKIERIIRFPLTRIRTIMKTDGDVTIASQDAVILIAKATELFVQELAKEAYTYTTQGKRKTLQHRDIELAVDAVNALAFLEGTLEST